MKNSQRPGKDADRSDMFNGPIVANLLDRATCFAIATIRTNEERFAKVVQYVYEIPSDDPQVESVILWLVRNLDDVPTLPEHQQLQRVCTIRTELCNELSRRGWFEGDQ